MMNAKFTIFMEINHDFLFSYLFYVIHSIYTSLSRFFYEKVRETYEKPLQFFFQEERSPPIYSIQESQRNQGLDNLVPLF